MKNIKTKLLMTVATFLFLLALAPVMNAEAATAPKPKNIRGYGQNASTLRFCWDLDSSLKGKTLGKSFGYQIIIMDTKAKTIATLTEKNVKISGNTCIATTTSAKYKTQPVKVYVKTYIISRGKKVWSSYSYRYIVPRAQVTGGSVARGTTKARLYWNKVTGAQSYSLYLSNDSGKTFHKVATTTGTAANTPSLTVGKTYICYVQANNVNCVTERRNSTSLTYSAKKPTNTFAFRITYK